MIRRLSVLALLAATVVMAACGSDDDTTATAAGASASENVTLRIAYIGTAGKFNGPEGYANEQGKLLEWLKPAGVTAIKPVEFANGPLATQALVGGSVDIIIAGDTPQLIARSQGVKDTALLQNRGRAATRGSSAARAGRRPWRTSRAGGSPASRAPTSTATSRACSSRRAWPAT